MKEKRFGMPLKCPFFWGIGLLIHALRVFDRFPFFGNDWEQRKIKELLEKETKNNQK